MAVDVEKTGEELGGLRRIVQDFLAPELGGIKATLASLHEGQQQMRQEMQQLRQDMKADQQQLRQDMKADQQQLRQDVKESQHDLKQDVLRVIEVSANELKALIKASDAERRLADSERRNAELERRLAEAGKGPQLSA